MEYSYRLPIFDTTRRVILSNLGIELHYVNHDKLSGQTLLKLGNEPISLGEPRDEPLCVALETNTYCFQTIKRTKTAIYFSVFAITLFPSGNDIIDARIMTFLPAKQLGAVCRSNRYLNKICKDNEFWRLRLSENLGFPLPRYDSKKINYAKLGKKVTFAFLEEGMKLIEGMLVEASGLGYTDLLPVLINHGADVIEYQEMAIEAAARNGHVETIKFILNLIPKLDRHYDKNYDLGLAPREVTTTLSSSF